MKRLTSALVVTVLSVSSAQADVIKPVDVKATSMFALGLNPENLINGDSGPDLASPLPHYGLLPGGAPGVLDDLQLVIPAAGADAWGWSNGCFDGGLAGGSPQEGGVDCTVFGTPGVGSTEPVNDQVLEFEFDGAYDLTEMHIWNFNQEGTAPDQGLDEFEIEVSPDLTGETFTAVGTTYNITEEEGTASVPAQIIPLVASGVRRVRILINSNHGPQPATVYVGLSEVRFNGTLVGLDPAADGDKDGDVDGRDFLRWQIFLGAGELETFLNSTLGATKSEGDYDNNNVVNAGDFAAWEASFGTVSPLLSGLASVIVPEPATLSLAAFAALGGWFVSRRRRYQGKVASAEK